MLGDSAHGDNGQVHGLAMGGLQPWISATEYEADASETLWQVLKRVFDAHGFDYSNSSGNYIASINGLSEFTNGKNSGWMYTLNGTHPTNGVNEQYLKNGDVIVFHYTDDYTKEEGNMGPVQTPSTAMFYGRVRTTDSVWGEIGRHIFCYPRGYLTQEAN